MPKKTLTLEQFCKIVAKIKGLYFLPYEESVLLLYHHPLSQTIHSEDNIFQPTTQQVQRIIPSFIFVTDKSTAAHQLVKKYKGQFSVFDLRSRSYHSMEAIPEMILSLLMNV